MLVPAYNGVSSNSYVVGRKHGVVLTRECGSEFEVYGCEECNEVPCSSWGKCHAGVVNC
jgi:hypothetical protein